MNDDLIARAEAALEGVTPGPWGARWHDPQGELEHYSEALRLSRESDKTQAVSSTAFRVITEDGDNWLNIAFTGNGPCSERNTAFIAASRELVPALLARVRELEGALRELAKGCDLNESAWDVDEAVNLYFDARRRARAALGEDEG